MLKIKYSGRFYLMLASYYSIDNDARLLAKEKIKLFRRNPDDTRLRNHLLKRKLKGRWAFSITDDIRIVYEWKGKNMVKFLAIGPHKKVYNGNN